MKKTIVTLTAITALTVSTLAFAQDTATKKQRLTPPTPPVQSNETVVAASTTTKVPATPTEAHQVRQLFVKDGCVVYEFYKSGVAHLLVTGQNANASCAIVRQ